MQTWGRGKYSRGLIIVALLALIGGLLSAGPFSGSVLAEGPNAVVTDAACNTNALAANDDGSSPQVNLGFTINFFGTSYTKVYANNNGNVTFDAALSAYTPTPIVSAGKVIIAPFWADVDTRGSGSTVTKYGLITFNGRPAFCVNWINVGSYNSSSEKLNSFQLILVDRGDTGASNFDIIMNYDKVQWETGSAISSNGKNGLGGNSARVGYSNGSNTSFELPGSAVNGAFLDSGPAGTALIKNSRNSNQLGRYIYQVRTGAVQPPVSPSPSASVAPSPSPGNPACLSPAALDFGTQIIGGNAPSQLALLNNCGSTPLTITATTMGGTNPADFEITSSCAGTTIAVGASCGIRAVFHPATTGARSATVTATFAGGSAVLTLTGIGDVPHPPFTLNLLTNGPCNATTVTVGGVANPGPYQFVTNVTLTPNPAPGATFLYWRSERGFMGWADPWTFAMNADHTVTAFCATTPSFPDYTAGTPSKADPIIRLAALQIIRGFQDGHFGPTENTKRAQMAALIARGMGYDRVQTWDQEDHGNTFPDRGPVDDNLWRNVGTLYYYNVARGFQDGTYQPLGNVLYAQIISFITRAMVLNGYWEQKPDNPSIYPNVPLDSGHRSDLTTFVFYAGAVPGTGSSTENWAIWNQDSTRAWFSQAEWLAINSYFSASSRFAP